MTRILNHLKGNVVGYVALFIALGGTSYAAVRLPAGSVHTQQLSNAAVTQAKLAKRSVGASALDPKSIGGHVAFMAQINANGSVVSSKPKAHLEGYSPGSGVYDISWHGAISGRCIALGGPHNASTLHGPVWVQTRGPFGRSKKAGVDVVTYTSAGIIPESFSVAVVCP